MTAFAEMVREIVVETVAELDRRRKATPAPETYTTSEAAVVLGVTTDHVGRLCREGLIRTLPRDISNKYLIPRSAIDDLLSGAASTSPAVSPTVLPLHAGDVDGATGRPVGAAV
ncbi:MAG: helix-turn-helix domain-containing protein [Actinomycetota bacterium]